MKTIKIRKILVIPAIFKILVLVSCVAPEEWSDKPETKTVPPIVGASVENIPGGAIITYTAPNIADLAYVKALYTLPNGTASDKKSSVHSDPQILVEGFGRAQKQTVQLICVDKSGNESTPYMVEIEPLDSPIYEILKTVVMTRDLGGFRVTWENPLGADIVLNLFVLNQFNIFVEIQNTVSRSLSGKFNHRGDYEEVETTFAVSVSDKFGNKTGLATEIIIPISVGAFKGDLLDRSKYSRWNPPGIPYLSAGSGYEIENMWNSSGYAFVTGFQPFTFDLGQTVILTKLWTRQAYEWYYTYYNLRRFQLWGSEHPEVNESTLTWTYMGEFISTKPSGLPGAESTEEDREYAHAGEEMIFKPEHRFPVRYIRIDPVETWRGDKSASIGELWFDGVPVQPD